MLALFFGTVPFIIEHVVDRITSMSLPELGGAIAQIVDVFA